MQCVLHVFLSLSQYFNFLYYSAQKHLFCRLIVICSQLVFCFHQIEKWMPRWRQKVYFCRMESNTKDSLLLQKLSFENFKQEVLQDYSFACLSRETSLLGEGKCLQERPSLAFLAMVKKFLNWRWLIFISQY